MPLPCKLRNENENTSEYVNENMSQFLHFVHENEDVIMSGIIVKIKLCNIPPIIIHEEIVYELRGVICFHRGKSNLRSFVGHYNTYIKRDRRIWEMYDDLRKKAVPVKETETVPCETIFYTI